jgi:hypothetical protein
MESLEVNFNLLINLIFKSISKVLIDFWLELITVKSDPSQILTIFQFFLYLKNFISLGIVLKTRASSFSLSGEGVAWTGTWRWDHLLIYKIHIMKGSSLLAFYMIFFIVRTDWSRRSFIYSPIIAWVMLVTIRFTSLMRSSIFNLNTIAWVCMGTVNNLSDLLGGLYLI